MSGIFRAIRALAVFFYSLATPALALLAVLALFGFAVPLFDLFNHMQPVLFGGGVLAVVLAPLLLGPGRRRALALTIAATGLTASGFTYVPEALSRLTTSYPPAPDTGATYRLMTFNVFGRNETPMAIVDSVRAIDPDILALQEYSYQVRRAIHEPLLETLPHFQYCQGGQRAFVGLYSRIPFEPLEDGFCSGSIMNPDRIARIVAAFAPEDDQRFVVATTHHDWPAPIWRQREQFGQLADAIANVPEPYLVVADFNSTPWSYALRDFQVRAGLTRHTRNLPTFPVLWHYLRDWRPMIPILPIDHVMSRGDVVVHEIAAGPASGSDHYPVIVTFSLPSAAGGMND